ncbi:MAG TPA: hypothetical protein VK961_20035 [Chthoniobacter sp.]|nr:hypothetical protein [Chthoniobacter sp.]
MRAPLLSIVLTALLSCVSSGVILEDEVTPQNLESQGYKFTIVPRGKVGLVSFKVTIDTKDQAKMPDGTSALLVIKRGKKVVAEIPVEMVRTDQKIEVREFFISSEYLSQSTFEFGISSGLAPSGAVFIFRLKNFVGH